MEKQLIRKELYFQVKATDDTQYIIRGIFSTPDIDRHGEQILQNGWKTDEYMLNPVVLWGHDQWTPAIGKMIELGYDADGNLAGAIQFAVEEYEFAKTIYNLYKGQYIRAFSVGFMNDVWEVDESKDVVVLKENTLYEVSAVNVPANAMALAISKGLDLAPLEKAISDHEKQKMIKQNNENKLLGETIVNELKKTLVDIVDKAQDNKSKVETPAGQGDKSQRIKAINNAIRSLLQEKKAIKN